MTIEYEFDLTEVTKDDLEGYELFPEGHFHCVIDAVEEDNKSEKPCIVLRHRAAAGTDPSAIDRVVVDRIYLTKEAEWRSRKYASRLGLLAESDLGAKRKVRFDDAQGLQVCITTEHEPYTKRNGDPGKSCKVVDIYLATDPHAAKCPKDKQLLATASPATGTSTADASRVDDSLGDI